MAKLDDGTPPPGEPLRNWVDRWPADDPPGGRAGAAVTIVLRNGRRDAEVLLIERTVRDNDLASGQVALPGGRTEPEDATMGTTALRELSEEVGLGPGDVELPLRLVGVARADLFGLDVAVFAARLSSTPAPVVPSPNEVAHVFWLPASALTRVEPVERMTTKGPLEVPAVVHQGHVLWGFTLRILRDFFREPQHEGGSAREGPASP